jgi:pimeloyl-ACP methyl ester carboxylesterase
VRLGPRNPVDEPKPVANRAHAAGRGQLPAHRTDVILASVDEHTISADQGPIFYRSAPVVNAVSTPVYLHGVPTSSDDWCGLLERTGGIAPDLIGFGRSSKAAHLDYTLDGLAAFLERFLVELSVERVTLVGHDWGGAVGLVFAQRHPDRVDRLVLCDAVPLLEGFAWDRTARLLRRPGVGELIMGSTPRWLLWRFLRQGAVRPEAFPDERLRAVWEHFDQGTQRAILRLYRATGERDLAAAGSALELLRMPTLVLWGERDPWLPPAWADAYGRRLPHAAVERIDAAGHWPWLGDQVVAERIAAFVGR